MFTLFDKVLQEVEILLVQQRQETLRVLRRRMEEVPGQGMRKQMLWNCSICTYSHTIKYIYIYYNIHNYRLWTVYIFAWHLNPFRWESTDHFNPLGLARVSVFEICIVWRKRHLQYISLKYLPWPSGPFSERAAASLYSSDSSWKLPIPLLGPRKALDGHNILPGALEVSRHLTIFQGRFVQFATDSFDCLVWTLVDEVAQEIIVLVIFGACAINFLCLPHELVGR